jgi:Peptidase A4 family
MSVPPTGSVANRPRRRRVLALAAAAAAATTAVLAVPAAATTTPGSARLTAAHHQLRFTPAAHVGTPIARAGRTASGFNQDGGNWSGYAATGSGFSSVTSSWTEPAVTCNSTNDLFAPWVGIDGYGTSTVEQTGVATDCSSGRPVYQGWYEMYPAGPVYYSNPAAAGDRITATVTRSGSTYTLTLSDQTQGWTRTTTQSLGAANASVEVIMESPTASYPNFGTVNFSGSRVNGGTLGSTGPVALDASNRFGFEDHTGPLSGGTDFSISYLQE